MELIGSRGAKCLPRFVYLLQTSVAFFLTFHDATFHMRGPFKYPPRIACFQLVIACFLECSTTSLKLCWESKHFLKNCARATLNVHIKPPKEHISFNTLIRPYQMDFQIHVMVKKKKVGIWRKSPSNKSDYEKELAICDFC